MPARDGTPLIAIVGNVIAKPGEADRHLAEQAAVSLGRQLATAGYRIVVYSSDLCFLEPHVVSGYVSCQSAKEDSICVKYPRDSGRIDFPEMKTHSPLFVLQADSISDWEVSFYDSLREVDGVLLAGGGKSTLIAGLVAMGFGVAVLPISAFGGYAPKVWDALAKGEGLTERERGILANPTWEDDCAKSVIGLFHAYWDRKQERRRMLQLEAAKIAAETKRKALLAVLLFLAAATLMLLAALYPADLSIENLAAMLVLGAPCAGISGGAIRTLADLGQSRLPKVSRPTYLTVALGAVAGVLSALLIALPQLLAARDSDVKRIILAGVIPTALITAFFAGFALDQFYRKLRKVELKDIEIPEPRTGQ